MYSQKFLIANPVITDPAFAKRIVFITTHNSSLAEGIVVNSSVPGGEITFGDATELLKGDQPVTEDDLKELLQKSGSYPLSLGGPCQTGIYFIHAYEHIHRQMISPEDKPEFDLGIPSSFETSGYEDFGSENTKSKLLDGIYYGNPDSFVRIVNEGLLEEKKFRFFIGNSTWGPGQLEHEIACGAWRIMDANSELFFNVDALNSIVLENEKPLEFSDSDWDELMKPSLN